MSCWSWPILVGMGFINLIKERSIGMTYELENLDEFIDSFTGSSNTYGGIYNALKRIQQYGQYRFDDSDFDVSRAEELSNKVFDRLLVDYYNKHLDGVVVDVWGEIKFNQDEDEEDIYVKDLYLDYGDRDIVNEIMLYVIDETRELM